MTPERTRLICAIALGFLAGFVLRPIFSDRYSINVVHDTGPIRIDHRTGRTWQYAPGASGEMVWKPIEVN